LLFASFYKTNFEKIFRITQVALNGIANIPLEYFDGTHSSHLTKLCKDMTAQVLEKYKETLRLFLPYDVNELVMKG
jgi:hypothetical protein